MASSTKSLTAAELSSQPLVSPLQRSTKALRLLMQRQHDRSPVFSASFGWNRQTHQPTLPSRLQEMHNARFSAQQARLRLQQLTPVSTESDVRRPAVACGRSVQSFRQGADRLTASLPSRARLVRDKMRETAGSAWPASKPEEPASKPEDSGWVPRYGGVAISDLKAASDEGNALKNS